jgi:hypothetical protein
MRFSKPLAAASILGVTLLGGTALTGTAFADAAHPHPAATAQHDDNGRPHPHKTAPATPSVEASLSPDTVGQGGTYTVSITTTNVDDGTDATASGPDGQSSTVAVEGGAASTTLSLTQRTRPGTYTVSVDVDGVSATATLTVTR